MTQSSKLETIGTSTVVDKLPSLRSNLFSGVRGNRETQSMTTDKAKQSPDDTSYSLDEKSTIDEDEGRNQESEGRLNASGLTTSTPRATTPNTANSGYLSEQDVLSMSANSSANFSFHPNGSENGDAYPALYDPELQAEYEKMKLEEQQRKEREQAWGPMKNVVEFFQSGFSKLMNFLESACM